jgi:hypothetical protein
VWSARIGHINYTNDEGEHTNLQKQALLPRLHLRSVMSWEMCWFCLSLNHNASHRLGLQYISMFPTDDITGATIDDVYSTYYYVQHNLSLSSLGNPEVEFLSSRRINSRVHWLDFLLTGTVLVLCRECPASSQACR